MYGDILRTSKPSVTKSDGWRWVKFVFPLGTSLRAYGVADPTPNKVQGVAQKQEFMRPPRQFMYKKGGVNYADEELRPEK